MKNSLLNGLLTSALAALLLGACSAGGDSPRYSTGAETEKRNTVELVRMPYLLLSEADGSAEMSASSLRGVNSFLKEIDLRGNCLDSAQGLGQIPDSARLLLVLAFHSY